MPRSAPPDLLRLLGSVGPDKPLRLSIAAALAYPDGSMTASGLRLEAGRGRLVIERTAGKDYTTLAAIERMRALCRVPQKESGSGCAPKSETRTAPSASAPYGLSETDRARSARAALHKIAQAPSARSASTLRNKYQPTEARGRHPSEILIADVLAIYLTDVAPRHAREDETKQRVLTLDAWWGDSTLADVNGANCRAYVEHRRAQPWKSAKPTTRGGAAHGDQRLRPRRELEDLRAAINHHRREGLCSEIVVRRLP